MLYTVKSTYSVGRLSINTDYLTDKNFDTEFNTLPTSLNFLRFIRFLYTR